MSILENIQKLDRSLMLFILRIRRKPLDHILYAFTLSGYGVVWILLAILLNYLNYSQTIIFHKQLILLKCMFAPLMAWFLGEIIKRIFNRKRPFQVIEGLDAIDKFVKDKSFPSNHVGAAIAFALALTLHGHPYAHYISIWAVIVSFSRCYLGVHFPSDIFGGFLLGLICGFSTLLYI